MASTDQPSERSSRGLVKSPQDLAGGLFLIALALVGILGTLNLNFQTSTGVGPGMMPRATAAIVAALGLVLVISSFLVRGQRLTAWSIRGIIFVLGSALVFAATIRPLGLVFAGPLAVIISAFADKDTRWIEVAIFSVVMTFGCIMLFSFALKLPIPIDTLGIFDFINKPFQAFMKGMFPR